MILTKQNIAEWKEALNRYMKHYGSIDNFSQCFSDDEWLREYEGMDSEEVADEELSLFSSDG